MAVTTTPRADASAPITRFDRVERVVHWTNATLVLALLATGSALYFGPLSALVGRRETIKTIHVLCGLALPIPVVLGLLLGARFRADAKRLGRLDEEDWAWLKSRGRRGRVGKFNAGQKLNAAFVAGAIPVMLATGSIMRWFKPFPLSWRTGATFVHDWVFLILFVVVIGHIGKALADPTALKGMISGRVTRGWARRNRPRWLEELDREGNRPPIE
jgi:formate dehydrogenase subunit gamma